MRRPLPVLHPAHGCPVAFRRNFHSIPARRKRHPGTVRFLDVRQTDSRPARLRLDREGGRNPRPSRPPQRDSLRGRGRPVPQRQHPGVVPFRGNLEQVLPFRQLHPRGVAALRSKKTQRGMRRLDRDRQRGHGGRPPRRRGLQRDPPGPAARQVLNRQGLGLVAVRRHLHLVPPFDQGHPRTVVRPDAGQPRAGLRGGGLEREGRHARRRRGRALRLAKSQADRRAERERPAHDSRRRPREGRAPAPCRRRGHRSARRRQQFQDLRAVSRPARVGKAQAAVDRHEHPPGEAARADRRRRLQRVRAAPDRRVHANPRPGRLPRIEPRRAACNNPPQHRADGVQVRARFRLASPDRFRRRVPVRPGPGCPAQALRAPEADQRGPQVARAHEDERGPDPPCRTPQACASRRPSSRGRATASSSASPNGAPRASLASSVSARVGQPACSATRYTDRPSERGLYCARPSPGKEDAMS